MLFVVAVVRFTPFSIRYRLCHVTRGDWSPFIGYIQCLHCNLCMRHYRCKYEFLELYRGKGVTVILIITARVVVMDSIDDGARECSFVWFFSDVIAFLFCAILGS